MKPLRIVVLVSGDPSDIYFANQVSRQLPVVGILVEEASPGAGTARLRKAFGYCLCPWRIPAKLRDDRIVADHMRRTSEIDRTGFGDDAFRLNPPSGVPVLRVAGKGALNAPEQVEALRRLSPDVIVVCGTSILKAPMLAVPPLGVLNLHGGLAQRYRGVWTTLWAVVNREPEYVGATVHFVSPGIDDGDIVLQGRPEISADDNPESLYVKVVKLGVAMMVRAVRQLQAGSLQRHPLPEKGRLYLSRMVTPEVLRQAWSNTEAGVVVDYLRQRDVRDAAVVPLLLGDWPAGREE